MLKKKGFFQLVRKNKTAFHPTLDPKGTLSSTLTIRFGSKGPAHQLEPPKELLKKALHQNIINCTLKSDKIHLLLAPIIHIFMM